MLLVWWVLFALVSFGDDYKYMDVIDLVSCSQIVIGIVNLQPENLKRVSYFEIYFRFYLMRWLPVRTIEDLKDPQLFSPAIISSLKPQWPMVLWSRCLRIKLRRGTSWEVGEDKKWLRKQNIIFSATSAIGGWLFLSTRILIKIYTRSHILQNYYAKFAI